MLGQETREAKEPGRIGILPAVGKGRRGNIGKGAGTEFPRLFGKKVKNNQQISDNIT